VELIGEYRDSGFVEPPYLLRRGDGQVIQISRLLYLVAEASDGQRRLDEIAERVSSEFGRAVSADNVRFLIDEKLVPAGIVATEEPGPPPPRASPLLGLRFRLAVLPPGVVGGIAAALRPLFLPPIVIAALAAFAALDVWLFAVHGIWGGIEELILNPALMLPVGGLIVLSAAFHECGHAAGCRYGGARPGALGAGIYVVAPVFYTDVTDAYRLGRGGRLRTDLGGVYFNVLFILLTAGAYLGSGWEPLLVVILAEQLIILEQLVPWLRLDGYYVVSDLAGVPDAFAQIRPVLRSVLPGRRRGPVPSALTTGARRAMVAYVASILPALALTFVALGLAAPGVIATGWDSFRDHLSATSHAWSAGDAWDVIGEGLQVGLLALPVLGIALTLGLVTWRAVGHLRARRPAPQAEAPAA
jgi:putative peptide zinc metalloprotease protein